MEKVNRRYLINQNEIIKDNISIIWKFCAAFLQIGSSSSIVHNFRLFTSFNTAHLQITMRVKAAFSDERIRIIIIQYCRVESPTAVKCIFRTENGIKGRASTLDQPKDFLRIWQ